MIDRHVVTQLKQQAQDGKTAIAEYGSLTVKLVPCNKNGNAFLLIMSKGGNPPSPELCYEWGAALGVPRGTEWETGDLLAAAWCEWPSPYAVRKMVQP